MRTVKLLIGVAAIGFLLISPAAFAANIWDGGGGDDNWSTAANWDNDTVPASATNTPITIGTGGSSITLDSDRTVQRLTLNRDGDFSLNGTNTISIAGSTTAITRSGTTAESFAIACPITLLGNQTWANNNLNSPLIFDGLINNGTYLLTLSGTGNLTVNGVIGNGTGGVTKTGVGTVTLNGQNTYTGTTTVSVGTLIGNTASIPANLAISTGAFCVMEQETDGTYGSIRSGAGTMVKNGDGTLTLTGTNTNTGATILNAGTLAGSSSSIKGATVNNATLYFDQAALGTYAGAVSGTGIFIKEGAGNLVLTGANSYTGGTYIKSGTLTAQTNASALPMDMDIDVSSGATVHFAAPSAGYTFSGNIIGAGALLKTTSYKLTLTGTNTYSGGTTISAGSLVGTTDSLKGQIANTGNLTFNQDYDGTFATAGTGITGTGTVAKAGAGTVALLGTNSYTGVTTISAGTLVGTTSSIGNAQANITNNSVLVFDQASNVSYGKVVSGTGALIKEGAGTITLTANQTNTGGTIISEGAIALGAAIGLANTGDLTVAGGTYNLGTYNDTVGAVTLSSGSITGSGILTGTSYNVESGAISARLGGTGATLTKSGTGTVTLSNTALYRGGTNINGGTLSVTETDVLAYYAPININGGTLHLSGLERVDAPVTITDGAIIGNAMGALVEQASNTITIENSALISGQIWGYYSLTKNGAGTLTFAGSAGYSGTTTINGGSLALSGPNTNILYSTVIMNSGTTLDMGGYDRQIGGLGGIADIDMGNNKLTVGYTGVTNNTTYEGLLTGTAGFQVQGSTKLTLTQAPGYTGTTTVNGGTLKVGNLLSSSTPLSLNSGGVIDTQGYDVELNNFTMNGGGIIGGGLLTTTKTIDDFDNGVLGMRLVNEPTSLTKNGTGTMTLATTNFFSDGVTVNAGTLKTAINNALAPTADIVVNGGAFYTGSYSCTVGDVTLNDGFLSGKLTGNSYTVLSGAVAGTFSGTAGLTKTGTGTVYLGGQHDYTGTTLISQGTLQFGQWVLGYPDFSSNVVVDGGVLAAPDYHSYFGAPSLTLENGAIVGDIYIETSSVALKSGEISASISGCVTKTTAGTVTVTGPYGQLSFADGSVISAGTIEVQINDGLYGNVTIESGATLKTEGYSNTLGALNGTGLVALGTGSLTLGQGDNSSTFSGEITGTGNLEKTGTGTLTLNGAYTFGQLTISGGILDGSGALTIDGITSTEAYVTNTIEKSFVIAGAGGISVAQDNTLILTGTNNYSGTNFIGQEAHLTGTTNGIKGNIDLGNDATVTFDQNSDGTFAGQIHTSGYWSYVEKYRSGTVTLAQSNTNFGDINIYEGTLKSGANNALGDISAGEVYVWVDGGTLDTGTSSNTVSYMEVYGNVTGTGTIRCDEVSSGVRDYAGFYAGGTYGPANDVSHISANLTGSANLVVYTYDGQSVSLTGSNSYTGGTYIGSGTLIGTTNSICGDVTMEADTHITFDQAANGTSNSAITGDGSLEKKGSGTVTLTAENTFTGTTTVSGGELVLASDGKLTGSSDIAVKNGGTLKLDNSSVNLADRLLDYTDILLNGGTLALIGNSAEDTTETVGTVTISGSRSVITATKGTGHEATLTIGSLTRIDNAKVNFTGSGKIVFASDTAPLLTNGILPYATFESTDYATYGLDFVVTRFTDYVTDISQATSTSVVKISDAQELPADTTVYGLVLDGGTLSGVNTLTLGDGMLVDTGTNSVLSCAAIDLGPSQATITTNGTLTISGTLIGNSGFVKNGDGTIILEGAQSYTGPTVLNDGKLVVSGIVESSDILVQTGAILSGSGEIGGTVTIADGGIWAPGNSPGTTPATDAIFGPAGIYEWEINDVDAGKGTNPGWDWLNIAGTLEITARELDRFIIDITSLTLGDISGDVHDFVSSSNYDWIIASAASIPDFSNTWFSLSTANFKNTFDGSFSLAKGTDGARDALILSYTAGGSGDVPEPSTLLLLLPFIGFGMRKMRRNAK
jgi:autotransporter-associated beta strand protein